MERAAHSAAKVTEALEMLATEVAALQSGAQWTAFLALQSRLHAYSPGNALLIAVQHAQAYGAGLVASADPSYVAGFATWRALGRAVDKGQHGYMILAPCRYDRRTATDTAGQVRRLSRAESPAEGESVESRSVLAGFRIEHVFDVSQTSGPPLAEPSRPKLLEGDAPVGLGATIVRLIESHGFSVGTVAGSAAIDGANGQMDPAARTVLVRSDMDEAAIVKTLIHEAAHVLLHRGPPGAHLNRALQEVEAESVAFVVASVHGMATGDYSFPYVAAWAGKDGATAVRTTQQRVAGAARRIIEASPAPQMPGGKAPDGSSGSRAETSGVPGPQAGLTELRPMP